MGISGISPLSLLLILIIVMVLFGTNRLRTIGKDLGVAIKSFREGLESTDDKSPNKKPENLEHKQE
jgi:sec-independent protein translocase protein TatA